MKSWTEEDAIKNHNLNQIKYTRKLTIIISISKSEHLSDCVQKLYQKRTVLFSEYFIKY